MEEFKNQVRRQELINEVHVYRRLAPVGSSSYQRILEGSLQCGKILNENGIKFALVRSDNLITIYINGHNHSEALKALGY